MSDPALRAALFRFVDVRPACATPADVTRHLHELLAEADDSRLAGRAAGHHRPQARHPPGRRDRRPPASSRWPSASSSAPTPRTRCRTITGLWKNGVDATVDLLGEATVSEAEADRYMQRCEDALARRSAGAPAKQPGRDVNLSVKVSALTPLLRPEAPERGIEGARPRLRHLLRVARDVGAHLHVDMESFDTREAITRLTLDLLSEPEFAQRPVRRHRPAGLPRRVARVPRRADRLGARPRRAQHPFTIRLVKGAYWDHEVVQAAQNGWTPPVFTDRRECDRNFEKLTKRPDRQRRPDPRRDRVPQPALDRRRRGLRRRPPGRQRGARVPDPARPRRRHPGRDRRHRPPRALLLPGRRPRRGHGLPRAPPAREHRQRLLPRRRTPAARRPPSSWRPHDHVPQRTAARAAPRGRPPRGAGRARRARRQAPARGPDADRRGRRAPAAGSPPSTRRSPTRIVAHAHEATAAARQGRDRQRRARPGRLVARARRRARRRALPRRRHPAHAPPRARRAGRPRGGQAVGRGRRRRLRGDRLPRVLRRRARSRWARAARCCSCRASATRCATSPRGVTGVIAPWNFPLAIAAGMVSAALATGNAVVLKPAEQAPACAKAVVDALHAGGVPLDALHLLPGGDEAGKALVADPRIHTIAFTGSCAVGLQILERAAKVVPGQRHLKRVIAEMGGKNAVIVDSDADLDDVVPALLKSAFALRRPEVLRRLPRARARRDRRRAGRAPGRRRHDAAGRPGRRLRHRRPAGDRRRRPAADRALHRERHAAGPGRRRRDDGFYVAPTIFAGLPAGLPGHPGGDLRPGAVAGDRRRASSTPATSSTQSPFALTGGLFSPQPAHDRVRERAHAGRQPLRQPRDHRRDGRPPAVRRRQACRAPARRPAARTTCCSSSRPARSPRTPCATASSSKSRCGRRRRRRSRHVGRGRGDEEADDFRDLLGLRGAVHRGGLAEGADELRARRRGCVDASPAASASRRTSSASARSAAMNVPPVAAATSAPRLASRPWMTTS